MPIQAVRCWPKEGANAISSPCEEREREPKRRTCPHHIPQSTEKQKQQVPEKLWGRSSSFIFSGVNQRRGEGQGVPKPRPNQFERASRSSEPAIRVLGCWSSDASHSNLLAGPGEGGAVHDPPSPCTHTTKFPIGTQARA
ncbi:hypothetical protein CEXT_19281 [Caerostris extrusa]|uniref:Uncharacterized protein n=1 Tax=Caerostris extrusa TaxID=172846 RepID=A0AAV4X8X3_CAEEX|nr:hypothetical protein CEXT_19281 [Caerostris extrusa]